MRLSEENFEKCEKSLKSVENNGEALQNAFSAPLSPFEHAYQ